MSFSGDIKTIRVADAETPTDSVPARIRAVSVFSNGQGPTRFTITDNGVTVFDVDVVSGGYEYFDLPDLGIPCRNDLTISTADNLAEATIFYTGEVDLTAYTGESESESEGSLTAAIHLAYTNPDPLTVGSITPTFTRSTEATVEDVDGVLRTIPSGARPVHGMRVVENLFDGDMTTWTTSGATVTEVTGDVTPPSELPSNTRVFRLQITAGSGNVVRQTFDLTDNEGVWISAYVKYADSAKADFQLFVNSNDGSGTLTATAEWQRFAYRRTDGFSVTGQYGFADEAEEITDADIYVCVPNLTGIYGPEDYAAPHEPVSRDVGVGAELLTQTITASDWTAFGNNTVTDNGDGSVKITWVDNGAGAYINLTDLDPSLSTTNRYDVMRVRAKVGSGDSVDIRIVNGSPEPNVTVTSTSYKIIDLGAYNYDGSGNLQLRFNNMGVGDEIDIFVDSIKSASHLNAGDSGGIKYFSTHNGNTFDPDTNIVTAGTGAAITDSNAKFLVADADNGVTTPPDTDWSGTNFTGVAYIAPEDGDANSQVSPFAQWAAGQKAFLIRRDAGSQYECFFSDDGSTDRSVSLDYTQRADGVGFWIRIDYNEGLVTLSTCDLSHTATYAELDAAFVEEDSGTIAGATTMNADSTQDIGFFGGKASDSAQMTGRGYKAALWDSNDITTTPKYECDPSDWTSGSTWTGATDGFTYTINGNAYIYTPPVNATGPLGYRPWASVENLLTYSEAFDNAAWTKVNATVTADQIVAPDGTLTADVLGDDGATGTGTVRVQKPLTVTSDTDVTVCIWAKAKQLSWMTVRTSSFGGNGNGITYFNLATAATGTVDANHTAHVEQYPDGWVRCGVTFRATTDLTGLVLFEVADGDGDNTVDLDGTSDIYIWGAMAADGWSVMPPYVATAGSTVTRNADVEKWTGFSYSNLPLTIVARYKRELDTGGTEFVAELSDGSADNRCLIYVNAADTLIANYRTGSSTAANVFSVLSPTTGDFVVAGAFDVNDVELYLDGASVGTPDTSAADLGAAITQLNVGSFSESTLQPSNYIQSVKVFTSRLTDAQVAAEAS